MKFHPILLLLIIIIITIIIITLIILIIIIITTIIITYVCRTQRPPTKLSGDWQLGACGQFTEGVTRLDLGFKRRSYL